MFLRDTELRFVVHDSADYYNLKLSVFSEDKRTDLIGEAFVDLSAVIIPGGGTNDIWQGLTCKGKYAGEVRLELTYYDSRPKPERSRRGSNAATEDGMPAQKPKVKRRPVPGMPSATPSLMGNTAESIENFPNPTARVRNGPRELSTPPRAASLPPDVAPQHPGFEGSPAQFNTPPPSTQSYEAYGQHQEPQEDEQYAQPDFLPQLPPTPRRQVVPQGPSPMMAQAHGHHRGQSHGMMPHANSAPIVPTVDHAYDPNYGLHTEAPEPLADLNYQHQRLRQRRNDVPPGWENPYDDPYNDAYNDQHFQDEDPEDQGPPPPPMHTHSAPVIPQRTPVQSPQASRYNGMSTPPSARQQYIPNASPLQSIERGYSSPQHTPPPSLGGRGRSNEEYTSSPPHPRSYDNTPAGMTHSNMSSPGMRSPASRALPNRHSMADIYHTPPPRPHPLSQEVPRARSRSPMPPFSERGDPSAFDAPYNERGNAPMTMPREHSPAPSAAPYSERQAKSTYSLQFPVRAFESSDGNPLATTRPHTSAGSTPQRPASHRRSVSPMVSPTDTVITPGNAAPFSPDSYEVHNPSTGSPMASGHSANAPFQIRGEQGGASAREGSRGPIVGWDGREIDPSDHLPVDSWAPEPEKKAPTKTYGLGRNKDFGPRSQNGTSGAGTRLSNDTVINFRRRSTAVASPQSQPMQDQHSQPASPARNHLFKPAQTASPRRSAEPLRERPNFNSTPPSSMGSVPDPYTQEYTRGFYESSPGTSHGEMSRYDHKPSPNNYYGDGELSREIANIDLGAHSGSTRRMPTVSHGSPSGWQGVRSHRDRGYY